MKALLHFIGKMISENIAGGILATQSDNYGIKSLIQDAPLWRQIKFEKPFCRRKVKPFADKEQNTCLAAYFICQ